MEQNFTIAALGALIVLLVCVMAALAAWSARKQRERTAEIIENWCREVTKMAEEKTK